MCAWSIFDQPSGKTKAEGWAIGLLQMLGVQHPTQGDVQFVYDWELAEGGGGKNNPLNIGPDPHRPGLALTGSQYGGGAADYASLHDAALATVDYLHMPNFQAITKKLQSNDPSGARSALIASPWAASHYGGGKGIPHTKLPDPNIKFTPQGIVPKPTKVTPLGVVEHLPGAAAHVGSDVGNGAVSAVGSVAGIGSWVTKNIVLVLVVVILVVLIKK